MYIFIGIDETLDFLNDMNFFGRYRFLNFNQSHSFYKHCKINKLRILKQLLEQSKNIISIGKQQ